MKTSPEFTRGLIDFLERISRMVTGREVEVVPIRPEENELGYTDKTGKLHVSFENRYTEELPEKRRTAFAAGITAHELLHQCYTDFNALEKALDGREQQERSVMQLLHNIVEDPAIEYRAPNKIGGFFLKALRFTIRFLYFVAPKISEAKTPFEQLCNALIQFGDMGLLKGKFTFPEAKIYFNEIAPEFNQMIRKSVCEDRIQAAARWTELTRPLWEREKKLSDTIQSIENANGISSYTGESQPTDDNSDMGPVPETPESKRRNRNAKKTGKEKEQSSDQSAASNEHSSDSGKTGKDEEHSVPGKEAGRASDLKQGEEQGEEQGASSSTQDGSSKEIGEAYGLYLEDPDDDLIFDELDLTDEDVDQAEEEIRSLIQGEETPFIEDLDIPVNSRYFGKASCINHRMFLNSTYGVQEYQKIAAKYENVIAAFVKNMQKIFASSDNDQKRRAKNGKINLKRVMQRNTVRICDRRRISENIDDIAVFMAVDESGSMGINGKITTARDTALILAESLYRLKIPCYVMGYTADAEGVDVVHRHYITWSNTLTERASLTGMTPQNCNFDGYSIRYAAQQLKKRRAEHKILLVISDGAPNCHRYPDKPSAVADTADAIRTAKQRFPVFGFGIGNACAPEVLSKLYEGTFVFVKEIDSLPAQVCTVLQSVVKNY